MAHNETRNGLNENERLPRTWSRSTVADGRWMQNNTLSKYRNSDWFLASAIDGLLDKDDELTQAIADEAQARLDYDGVLSGRCDFLYTSATQIRNDLDKEVTDRKQNCNDASAHAYDLSKSYTDTASAYVFGHANDASAHALAEAKTYANGASAYLDGRINGVSSTFNSFSSDLKTWKDGVENWEGGIDDWKDAIDDWREDTVDPKLNELESAIAGIEGASDVYDVVATSASLNNYTGRLTPKAVIKVLSAGPNNDQQVYYRWNHTKTASGTWTIADFDYIGGVQAYYDKGYIDSNYYKKTETYNQTEVDNYLKWKVDASKSQNFTTPQQWQARQNIGASDGKIPWIQPDGSSMKTTSADLSITYGKTGDNYYRLRADDGTTTQDWVLVPEPTDGQNNYLLTVLPNGIGWRAPSAELPAVTRPDDVGKALVVGSSGLTWDDRGNGYYFVNLKSTNANTFKEVKAAASAHKTIIGYEEEYDSNYNKAYKYFTFAGEYWDQYAFFDSNTNEIQEKRKLWSAGNVSAYNQRFLYTSEQNIVPSEQAQVRENIDAAKAPLIIHMIGMSKTLSDDEMDALVNATTYYQVDTPPYWTPLVYIHNSNTSTERYYRFVLKRGAENKYIFASTTENDMAYIEIDGSTKVATRIQKLMFMDSGLLPDFSSNQETYYII